MILPETSLTWTIIPAFAVVASVAYPVDQVPETEAPAATEETPAVSEDVSAEPEAAAEEEQPKE